MNEETAFHTRSATHAQLMRSVPVLPGRGAFIPGEVQSGFEAIERAPAPVAGRMVLPDLQHALMLVDAVARIHAANEAARSLLQGSDVLCDRDGTLSCASHDDGRVLRDALRDLHAVHPGTMVQRQAVRTVRLYRPDGSQLRLFMRLAKPVPLTPGCAVVLVHDSRRAEDDSDADLVADALSLTLAEARVALKLANGWLVKDVARAHHTSVATVRSQVQHALQKVGVSRQVDLVRLLLALPLGH